MTGRGEGGWRRAAWGAAAAGNDKNVLHVPDLRRRPAAIGRGSPCERGTPLRTGDFHVLRAPHAPRPPVSRPRFHSCGKMRKKGGKKRRLARNAAA